ncbi:MAG: hypothetical protein KJS95_12680 [Gammaproteobacteria bacterium]|nr:hypothetical protein [Gammaproteobacteria bacterium]
MSQAMDRPEADSETSLRRRAWRAWRVFSWGRRVLAAPEWLQWGWAAFQTKVGVAIATGTVAAGALGTVAVVAPDLVPWLRPAEPPSPAAVVIAVAPPPAPAPLVLEPPAPVEAAPQKLAGDSTLFALTGADAAGRKASFELLLLSRAITWVRGSTSEIARDGEELSEEQVVAEVIGTDVKGRLATSQEIIAAGAASAEGDVDTETERAGERAATTAKWVRQAAPDKPVSTLNLGQYQARCASDGGAADTGWQRPLLIIGVIAKDDGVRLDEALRDAMSGRTNVPSPSCYSLFELARAN